MNRCKSCRRTTPLTLVSTTTIEDKIINTYMCECGYIERQTYQLTNIEGRFLGTLIYTEKDKEKHRDDLQRM